MRRTAHRGSPRPGEAGFALAVALFAMATLLLLVASALLIGTANVEATRNFRGAVQVHFVAESAISEGLQVANGAGVVSFQNDVVVEWATALVSCGHALVLNVRLTQSYPPVARHG